MLSQIVLVATRKAIESTYDCTCSVIEQKKIIKSNKSTNFQEIRTLENEKCKLSFENVTNVKQDDIKANIVQTVKLFIAPEIDIKPSSRIDVTNFQGITTSYKSSGKPAIYKTHQEIILEQFEGWA